MTRALFKRMCERLTTIAHMNEPEQRETHLRLFMSQGYLFLDLTDKQVDSLKSLFKKEYPDKFKEYSKPDEHGFTAEFEYLRFK